jgi:hypothetical protein
MSKLPLQQSVQDLNILGSVLESVQIGGVAGRDLKLTQIQGGVGALNVFGTVQVAQASLNEAQPISQEEYRRRTVLLNRVKKDWIEGVLKGSLHTKVLIELGLEERKDLVQSALGGVEEFSLDSGKVFSEGTSATDIFEEIGAGRTLLILGEPGAGKTVTLLRLAESLITRAENDLSQSLPVVMNLSSWAKSRKPILSWLVQELLDKYHVSKPLGKAWVEQEQLILLLDGLDEVDAQYRDECVKALNQFIQEHGLTEIVICSRIQDYKNLSEHLKLRSAIYVQPLKADQINQFLEKVGEPLSALKAVLQNNSELQAFASSPLILSIMSLAYQNYSAETLTQSKTLEDQRKHLFDIYIERMFTRRGTTQKYSRETTLRWLNWLAKNMVRSSQTVFLIERLQPDWLLSQTQRVSYRLATHLLTGLISALITMLIGRTFFRLIETFQNSLTINLFYEISSFMRGVFVFGLTYILSTIAVDLLIVWPMMRGAGLINPVESLNWSWKKSRQFAAIGMISGVLIGFIGGLVVGVLWAFDFRYIDIDRLEIRSLGLPKALFLTLVVGMIFSGIFGLPLGSRGNTVDAFPKKRTDWLWKTAKFSLIFGLVLGILLTLGFIINERATETLFATIFAGKILGLILGLIIALISGLIAEARIPRASQNNNASGTNKNFSWSWREARHIISSGILFGVFVGVFGGLVWGLFLIFVYPEQMIDSLESADFLSSMFLGLFLGLSYGVIFGGCLSLIFRLAKTTVCIQALWKENCHWRNTRSRLISGLFFGLSIGIVLFFYPESTFMVVIGIVVGIVLGIALGLIIAPIIGLIGGFRASAVSESNFPNQGIWKSLKSYAIFGVAFGMPLGLVHGSWIPPNSFVTHSLEFDYVLTHRLIESVVCGLAIYAPICGLFAGGLTCFKHLSLRLMLTCQGSTPWNYAQFLDYATDRFFMQKVGGSYIFVHRMLLEHFAEMNLRSK